jgi:hypothetical protein
MGEGFARLEDELETPSSCKPHVYIVKPGLANMKPEALSLLYR